MCSIAAEQFDAKSYDMVEGTMAKVFVQPRPDHNDYVMMLYSDPNEHVPSVPVSSKMAFLKADSPLLVNQPEREHPEHGWHYVGEDAEAAYRDAEISMGTECPGYLEQDYEGVRQMYPDKGLKPYAELTDEEKGRHYQSYRKMQDGFAAIGDMIRKK